MQTSPPAAREPIAILAVAQAHQALLTPRTGPSRQVNLIGWARQDGAGAPEVSLAMRSLLTVFLIAAAACAPATGEKRPAPEDAAEVPPKIAAILQEIRDADTGQLAVSEADGRFLRLLVATNRTRHALEIGAASGYSGIWIGLGLRETGGRLTTIEYDPKRAAEAAANIKRAGLDDVVQVIAGDAFKEIPKLTGPVDFVFLDAWKPDYKRFFDVVMPRLSPGGLFLAHNVLNKREQMQDFLEAVESHPQLWTATVAPSAEGVLISRKRG